MDWHKEGYNLDDFCPDNINFGFWQNNNGEILSIKEMDNKYLDNVIDFLKTRFPHCSKLHEFILEKRLRKIEKTGGN